MWYKNIPIPIDNTVLQGRDRTADLLRKNHSYLHVGRAYEGWNGIRTFDSRESKLGEISYDMPFYTWTPDDLAIQSPTKRQYYGEYDWNRQPVINHPLPWTISNRYGV